MVKIHAAALLTLVLAPISGLTQDFTLQLNNNLSPGATLYVAIYRETSSSWDVTPDYQLKQYLPQSQTLDLPLEIPAGNYALRAFIDLNDDQTLNTRSFDRPTEPFASSIGTGRRQPSVHFERSIIPLDAAHPRALLTLRYPQGSLSADQDTQPVNSP